MSALLSQRVQAIQGSLTMAISTRALTLRRQGRDIVSLSVGEPDFPVFPHVAQAIETALRKGQTKYTPSAGTPELREAIAAWMKREVGYDFAPSQVMATAGAKQALFNACQALVDEGSEVIVPVPGWVSYPEMARLAGGRSVELPMHAEHRWVPQAEALERAITERTRLVMLGTPANPTGAVWGADALRALAAVLERHPHVAVVSDDIYDELTYGGVKAVSLLQVAPQLADRLVLVNGCSKAYAMTGLRLGWAAGPADIIDAMCKVQDAATSNPSSLSQAAAIAALTGPQEPLEEMRRAFEKRRELMLELVRGTPGLHCVPPDGAYYVFADVRSLLGKRYRGEPVHTSARLAELLLEDHGVALVPGSAFGAEGYLRLSFATNEAGIRKAFDRIRPALASLE